LCSTSTTEKELKRKQELEGNGTYSHKGPPEEKRL
jgi:hypothetical protein